MNTENQYGKGKQQSICESPEIIEMPRFVNRRHILASEITPKFAIQLGLLQYYKG